jgi:hypothetical protein
MNKKITNISYAVSKLSDDTKYYGSICYAYHSLPPDRRSDIFRLLLDKNIYLAAQCISTCEPNLSLENKIAEKARKIISSSNNSFLSSYAILSLITIERYDILTDCYDIASKGIKIKIRKTVSSAIPTLDKKSLKTLILLAQSNTWIAKIIIEHIQDNYLVINSLDNGCIIQTISALSHVDILLAARLCAAANVKINHIPDSLINDLRLLTTPSSILKFKLDELYCLRDFFVTINRTIESDLISAAIASKQRNIGAQTNTIIKAERVELELAEEDVSSIIKSDDLIAGVKLYSTLPIHKTSRLFSFLIKGALVAEIFYYEACDCLLLAQFLSTALKVIDDAQQIDKIYRKLLECISYIVDDLESTLPETNNLLTILIELENSGHLYNLPHSTLRTIIVIYKNNGSNPLATNIFERMKQPYKQR